MLALTSNMGCAHIAARTRSLHGGQRGLGNAVHTFQREQEQHLARGAYHMGQTEAINNVTL